MDDMDGDSKVEIEAKLFQGLKELQKYKKGELKTKSAKEFADLL